MNNTKKTLLQSEQKNFWLILDNYVHISLKADSALLYNPLNREILEYAGSDFRPIFKLLRRLRSPQNLLVVRLTPNDLKDKRIAAFVNDVCSRFMGNLIDTTTVKKKPIQLMPLLKIHKDADTIKKSDRHSVGTEMMKYPVEISLYINSACSRTCSICRSAYKQFPCCTKGKNSSAELDLNSISDIFQQLKSAPLDRVNILGGDIFKYSQWAPLTEFICNSSKDRETCLYVHYLNLSAQEEKSAPFPISDSSVSMKVLVPLPVDKQKWIQFMRTMPTARLETAEFLFPLADDLQLAEAEEMITRFQIPNYTFHPFYNGENEDFFQQSVFLDKEDVQEAGPGTTEILARQLVNPFHFGRLTILSNGAVHANVNTPALGNIKQSSLYPAIYKEMLHGKSWRRTRKNVKPCKQCTYNALCPPLSNYEYALNKNNLCHILNRNLWGSVDVMH